MNADRESSQLWIGALAGALIVGVPSAWAQTVAPPATAASAAPAAPTTWMSSITLGAQIEAGTTLNPFRPADGLNFGQLYTQNANTILLNQLLLTAQRPLNSKATGYDIGFKLQLMYGSDARFTHFLGELWKVTDDRNQLDIVSAAILVHLPWFTGGGVDLTLGQYPSPIGYEVIDPSGNPFYSHSYIFNFGVPTKHTGGYAVWHASSLLDLYGGLDTGEQTTAGIWGENNGAVAGLGGFGLNLLGGNLTVLALSHFGPEDATRKLSPLGFNANAFWRTESDIVVTWKATPKLTFTTEGNFTHEPFFNASGYGAAQYVSYALTDTITLNARAEVWVDQNNFFVAAYPGNLDFVNSEAGLPTPFVKSAPHAATYSELTLGVTYKPSLPAPISNLMIRPEIRWDSALNGVKAFNDQRTSNAVTLAGDLVLGF
jgi:hypothetical protein